MCGCGSWGQGLVVKMAGSGEWLDLVTLGSFSGINDSVIP